MTPAALRALTVRQPWAWAILHAGKDIENRVWATQHRGLLAIHAAARHARGADHELARILGVERLPVELPYGAIVGVVDVVACRRDSASPWAAPGVWHWVLANPRPLPQPVPCRGRQQLWIPTPDVAARVSQLLD